jgi:hypothetical protein
VQELARVEEEKLEESLAALRARKKQMEEALAAFAIARSEASMGGDDTSSTIARDRRLENAEAAFDRAMTGAAGSASNGRRQGNQPGGRDRHPVEEGDGGRSPCIIEGRAHQGRLTRSPGRRCRVADQEARRRPRRRTAADRQADRGSLPGQHHRQGRARLARRRVEGGGAVVRTAAKLWFGLILSVFVLTGLSQMVGALDSWRGLLALPFIAAAYGCSAGFFAAPSDRRTKPSWRAPRIRCATSPCSSRSICGPGRAARRKPSTSTTFNGAYREGLAARVVGLFVFFGAVTTIVGLWLFVRAALILYPVLLGRRTCVVADEDGLTVHSLIGRKTLAWDRIDAVEVHTFKFWSVGVSTTTGTRRHLVVTGRNDFERLELLIPYTLCGLDKDGAKRLAQRIMDTRQGIRPIPAAVPRSALRPLSVAANTASAPAYRDTPESTFDPDAIMARHLAERSQVMEASGMPRPPGVAAPRGFGRKGVARAG